MKNVIKIVLLSIVLTAISCVYDKTVTDFVELNDVKITGINKNEYDILLEEEFILDPVLETAKNDESDLEFLWYYYQKFGSFKSDTISYDKVLKYTFKDLKIGGDYNLTLKIRDKISNVFYQKTVKINPINKYSNGTLLLCKENGETELNFLMYSKNIFLENVFEKENEGEKLDINPTNVYFISPYERNIEAFKAVLILNNTKDGGYYLNPATMKKENTIRRKLNGKVSDSEIDISHYCNSQTNDFIICNNKIRMRQGTMEPEANWSEVLSLGSGGAVSSNYNLAPLSLHPGYAQPLLYDNLNHRFLSLNDEGLFTLFTGDSHQMNAFDANNLGENMVMLCAGYFSDKNSMWALMKDLKRYYILRFKIVNGVFTAQAKVEVTSQMAHNLNGANKFSALTKVFAMNQAPWKIRVDGIAGRMAYLSNNNIYILNMNVNDDSIAESLLIEGGKEDVEITNIFSRTIQTSGEPYVRLDLCVKDNLLESKRGGIIFYKLNTLGGLLAQKLYKKTGFCDEVISLDEKLN